MGTSNLLSFHLLQALVDMNVAFVSGTPTKTMVKQISQIESEAWALSNKLKESNRGKVF